MTDPTRPVPARPDPARRDPARRDPVRLGLVGVGWWGRELAGAAARSGAAEVVACFARSESGREAFARDHGCRPAASFDALVRTGDVEGVVLATPHSVHLEQVRAVAAAGRHVLVEKPLALTTAEARQAVAAADRAGVVLMVGHQRRRQAPIRRIRELIDDGTLGTPLLAESTFATSSGYPDTWRSSRDETPLGAMTGLGVHTIDTFHYLLGPIVRVAAFSRPVLDGPPLDHATGVLFELASGASATLLCTHFAPPANRVAVHGTSGAAVSERDGARLLVQRRGEPALREVDLALGDPLAEQLGEFAAAVRGEAAVETGGREALAVVAVLEAAVASTRSGRAEPVPTSTSHQA